MKHTMYRPDSVEDTRGLIARTVGLLIEDYRVAEMLVETREWVPLCRREEESPVEYAHRCYRDILPTLAAADALHIRCQNGWSRREAEFIVSMINDAYIQFQRLAADAGAAFIELALRDNARKLEALRDEWQGILAEGTS